MSKVSEWGKCCGDIPRALHAAMQTHNTQTYTYTDDEWKERALAFSLGPLSRSHTPPPAIVLYGPSTCLPCRAVALLPSHTWGNLILELTEGARLFKSKREGQEGNESRVDVVSFSPKLLSKLMLVPSSSGFAFPSPFAIKSNLSTWAR